MGGNYEADRQLTRQRLNDRYRDGELHRLAKQAAPSGPSWRSRALLWWRERWLQVQRRRRQALRARLAGRGPR